MPSNNNVPEFLTIVLGLQVVNFSLTIIFVIFEDLIKKPTKTYDFLYTNILYLVLICFALIILKVLTIGHNLSCGPKIRAKIWRDFFVGFGGITICGFVPQIWVLVENKDPTTLYLPIFLCNTIPIPLIFLFIAPHLKNYKEKPATTLPRIAIPFFYAILIFLVIMLISELNSNMFYTKSGVLIWYTIFFVGCTAEFIAVWRYGVGLKAGVDDDDDDGIVVRHRKVTKPEEITPPDSPRPPTPIPRKPEVFHYRPRKSVIQFNFGHAPRGTAGLHDVYNADRVVIKNENEGERRTTFWGEEGISRNESPRPSPANNRTSLVPSAPLMEPSCSHSKNMEANQNMQPSTPGTSRKDCSITLDPEPSAPEEPTVTTFQSPTGSVCNICMFEYSDTVIPRMLVGCGHTVCQDCIEKFPRGTINTVLCPFCRKSTVLPDNLASHLPKNFAVLDMIQERKQ